MFCFVSFFWGCFLPNDSIVVLIRRHIFLHYMYLIYYKKELLSGENWNNITIVSHQCIKLCITQFFFVFVKITTVIEGGGSGGSGVESWWWWYGGCGYKSSRNIWRWFYSIFVFEIEYQIHRKESLPNSKKMPHSVITVPGKSK